MESKQRRFQYDWGGLVGTLNEEFDAEQVQTQLKATYPELLQLLGRLEASKTEHIVTSLLWRLIHEPLPPWVHAANSPVLDGLIEVCRGAPFTGVDEVCLSLVKGGAELVRFLMDREWDLVRNEYLPHSMCVAARQNKVDYIKYLLELGCDIHYREDLALCSAAQAGAYEACKLLLDKGAHVHTRNFDITYDYVRNGIIPLLYRHGVYEEPEVPFREAVFHGHLDVTKLFVEHGAKINMAWAVKGGHLPVVQYLLEVDPSLLQQCTRFAAVHCKLPVLQYVVEERGQPLLQTYLDSALFRGDLDMIRYIVPRLREYPGGMAVFLLHSGSVEVGQALLDHGFPRALMCSFDKDHLESYGVNETRISKVAQWMLKEGLYSQ